MMSHSRESAAGPCHRRGREPATRPPCIVNAQGLHLAKAPELRLWSGCSPQNSGPTSRGYCLVLSGGCRYIQAMSQTASSVSGPHPELADEQAFLDHAYECLQAMRDRAEYLKSLGYLGGNISEGGITPETAARWEMDRQRRIDALTDTGGTLCFGRIDRRTGDRFYVGRRHVENRDGEPIVTDWRAPVAVAFYRATVADPMALTRRRRFLVEHRVLADLFDEDFEHPSDDAAAAYVPDPL